MRRQRLSAIAFGVRVAVWAGLLAGVLVSLASEVARAQTRAEAKRVLVLYWYGKDFPGNVMFSESFQGVLKKQPGAPVEYYPEYLETDRFPGEAQGLVLRDYLRGKYSDRKIDAVVALADPSLNFMLEHRDELFPNAPIIFNVARSPQNDQLEAGPGMTGTLTASTHKETLDLALKYHPATRYVYVISGTMERDKRWEMRARDALQGYDQAVTIEYLTDLPLPELIERIRNFPKDSLVLYAWQQSLDEDGKLLESRDTLARISRSATVPFYGMSSANLGSGIIGGYLSGPDSNGGSVAKIVLRILNGERAQDIPVQSAPSEPRFDWRELQRWGIDEKDLPPDSVVIFRQQSFFERYRWQVIGVASLLILEAALIAVLLANRVRRVKAETENLRLAQVAEEERRRLDEVISNLPGIVWETRTQADNVSQNFIFVSDYAETMLGYTAEEVLSLPQLGISMVPDENQEAVLRTTEQVLKSGEKNTVRFKCFRKNGELLWVESHMAPVIDEEGRTIGLRGVTLDVTDELQAQDALRENRMQLAGIINSAMDAIISLDDNQLIVLLNPAAEKMFGYAFHEVTRQPIDKLLPNRFDALASRHIRANEAGSVASRSIGALGALSGRRANGEEFPIEASISQVQVNGRKFYTVVLRDITERIRAEEALRESEQRFRNMADTAPVMIWVSGPDKLCTYFNQRWLDFTGRTMGQEVGYGWADGVHADDLTRCLEIYNSGFDLRQPFKMEYRLRRADGQYRWVLDSATPRFSSSNDFLGFIGSCIDISERRATEEALMELSGHLISAQEDERRRIARELHDDLNQRMALISIGLERLRQKPPETSAKMRQQLQALMDQSLEISKEIHRMSYDLHPSWLFHVGLVSAVRGLCDELRPRHGLIVEFIHEDVPSNLPQDVSLCLYRIVQECLSNVIKHSGAQQARVTLQGSDHEIRLRVSDSGRGFDIASANAHKGLGLISMQERLRLVGGRVSINSNPSHGTQIDARVPLRESGSMQEGVSRHERTQVVRAD